MKVKIGNQIFTSDNAPITLIFDRLEVDEVISMSENTKDSIVYISFIPKIIFGRKNLKGVSMKGLINITKDEVGGFHDEGVGWNPQRVWCGECVRTSCKGCVNEKVTNKGDVTKNG